MAFGVLVCLNGFVCIRVCVPVDMFQKLSVVFLYAYGSAASLEYYITSKDFTVLYSYSRIPVTTLHQNAAKTN